MEKLRDLYAETEDEIELSGGKGVRTSVLKQDAPTAAAAAPAPAPAASSKPVAAAAGGGKR